MSRLHFLILILSFISLALELSVSEPRATEAAMICSNRTSPVATRQRYIANFLAAMDAVSPLIASQRYASVVNGTGNDTVYAFGECMKDLNRTDCNLCFAQIKTQILRCLPFQLATRGGRLFFDGCYLRYEDYNFLNETLGNQDRTVCASRDVAGLNRTLFSTNARQLVRNLRNAAPNNDGFLTGFVNRGNVTVHGLAQCWEYVNRTGCVECLGNAVSEIDSCPPKDEGRVLNAGCYLRFSTQRFYNNSAMSPTGGNQGRSRLAVILAVTSTVVALSLFVSATAFFVKKKFEKKRREKKQLGPLLGTVNKSNLNFSYETLEKATNYFSNANKLGQGGSGSVYKGTLPDGNVVAIKRLLFNTTQWVDHFFNEVNLISGIHHKNLVKLLGCSITGPESLLVYEYVPNQSLHEYLFVRKDVQPLSWDLMYNIFLGTAEGLAYLHEESTLKIIHRDIKLSNILLENDLTPKIADFGLARLIPEGKTHISTAIAGTLGYMAPEYVVRGKLTEKADIYSFGVLVIEIISRKRNNAFFEGSGSMLQMVWGLYGTGRLHDAVDPVLGPDVSRDAASRVLQIALLCVQALFDLRPSMSLVVKMLKGEHDIPVPTQPPFLTPGSAEGSQLSPPPAYVFHSESITESSKNSMSHSLLEPR